MTPLDWLSALALAVLNAALFPLWTGYAGGATPLPAGPSGWAPIVLLAAVNVAGVAMLARRPWSLGMLVALAALTRLIYIATRLAVGTAGVDPDVGLYFEYARQAVAGVYPEMEYPQGALAFFSGAYLLAGGEFARFQIIFPLTTLPWDLITVGVCAWFGRRFGAERVSTPLALAYALAPFTVLLWYGKYDAIPAALLALGLAWFAAERYTRSAAVLALGFLTKWFPAFALPFLWFGLVRRVGLGAAMRYALVAGTLILVPLAGFWSLAPEKVWYTYRVHIERPVMGESLLYLPLYVFAPADRLSPDTSPWNDVDHSALITNTVALGLLLAAEAGLLLIALRAPASPAHTAAFAGLGVATFILVNRVFSPQYLLVLYVACLPAWIALPGTRSARYGIAAATVTLALAAINYLIWPLWSPDWLALSALFFALNLALVGGLAYRAARTHA